MQSIFEQFQQEPRYRPSSLVPARLAAGLFGRKTGEGFYKYNGAQKIELAEAAPPAVEHSAAVWVSEGERRAELLDILQQAGAEIVDQPDAAAALLLMPWGEDITTTASNLGLDTKRAVGLDPLLQWHKRRVLMTSPATTSAARDIIHALLGADGTKVSVIGDSPGFVSQRVIAMIVNIACEIAQRGIARAAEIDPAIRIGLGYPKGPLELGDTIGAAKILHILKTIENITGDPRYRPSLWLRRRAIQGLSLQQEAA
jgi:3-hydroxybutyryl-CoA dehydrogenase